MLELLLLFLFCVLIGLSCLGAMAWVLLSGAEIGVERIFLLMVGSLVAVLFFGFSGWLITRTPLRALWKAEAASPPAPAPASKPGRASKEASKSAP